MYRYRLASISRAPADAPRYSGCRLNDEVRTFYYTNRSDIGPDVPLPTAPALFLLRVDLRKRACTTDLTAPSSSCGFGGFEK